jgi:hypothetical protein
VGRVTSPPVTRWITPELVTVDLIHATHTSNNHGRKGLRYGGMSDGWWLILRHPRSRCVLAEIPLDLDHSDPQVRADAERALARSLADIGAVPVIGR